MRKTRVLFAKFNEKHVFRNHVVLQSNRSCIFSTGAVLGSTFTNVLYRTMLHSTDG